MAAKTATASAGRRVREGCAVAFGSTTVSLDADDGAALQWLLESIDPWFTPTARPADWRVIVTSSASAFADLERRRPTAIAPRVCFAFDTEVVSLPTWESGGRTVLHDERRSCFFAVGDRTVDLVADPSSRRWRFTLLWILHEIVATRLRRTHLDLHSAAVATCGRALLIVGPKGAGKTTSSFHLLRSGRYRWIANDRAFVTANGGGGFAVRGMPTSVKIRPPMETEFPELSRGIPRVERPYLYSLDELSRQPGAYEPLGEIELALSPAQVADRLAAGRLGEAPVGAVLFPQVTGEIEGWRTERLAETRIADRLWANLYGGRRSERREPTVFEAVEGAASVSRAVAESLSQAVPGYHLLLGRNAYVEPAFSAGLRALLGTP